MSSRHSSLRSRRTRRRRRNTRRYHSAKISQSAIAIRTGRASHRQQDVRSRAEGAGVDRFAPPSAVSLKVHDTTEERKAELLHMLPRSDFASHVSVRERDTVTRNLRGGSQMLCAGWQFIRRWRGARRCVVGAHRRERQRTSFLFSNRRSPVLHAG